MKPSLSWIDLQNVSPFEQLQCEEALLRTDTRNICLCNRRPSPAIVMGISGKPQELLNLPQIQKKPIPVIRRFSGGGTVVIDEETVLITLIFNQTALPLLPFPEPILRWSAKLYQKAWGLPGFQLKENDYVIEERKCGGNAQYIQKGRWLHHSSFLWGFSPEKMQYLHLPPKRPSYRKDRAHVDFLTDLNRYFTSEEALLLLKRELSLHFAIEPLSLSSLEKKPHRQSTQILCPDVLVRNSLPKGA